MKSPRWIALTLALLVLTYSAAAWFLGQQVESTLDAQYKLIEGQPYIKILNREYQRGWLRSQERVTVELYGDQAKAIELLQKKAAAKNQGTSAPVPANPLTPIRFTLRTEIMHGPLPGTLTPAAGIAETDLELEGPAKQTIGKLFGDKKPLHVSTVLHFDGGGIETVTSPAATVTLPAGPQGADVIHFTWQGLTARIDFSRNLERYTMKAESPKIELASSKGVRMSASGITFTCDQQRIFKDEPLLYSGSQRFAVKQVNIGGEGANGKQVLLRQMVFDGALPVKGEFVDLGVKMGIEVVQVGTQDYGPAHYDFSLTHLHARTLAKVYRSMMDLYSGPAALAYQDDPAKMFAPLAEPGIQLMNHDPEFQLERISFHSPHGEARIAARVKLQDVKPEDFATPPLLIAKLDATANLSLPENLLSAIDRGAAATPQQAAVKSELLQQQLVALAERGYIKREGGLITSEITFKNSQVMANGKPLEPLSLGGNGTTPQGRVD